MESSHEANDDLRPHYEPSDLKGRVRGKYAERYKAAFGPKQAVGLNGHGDGYDLTSGSFLDSAITTLPPSENKAFIDQMTKGMTPIWVSSICPIMAVDPATGVFGQLGTGTLLQIADQHFLVTASHVVERAEAADAGLFICDEKIGSEKTPSIPLHGTVVGHPTFGHDVAIFKLPSEVVKSLTNRKFLSVHRTDRENRRIIPGYYSVFGYPERWSDPDLNALKLKLCPIAILSELYTGETSALQNYDPRCHLLLKSSPDRNGNLVGQSPAPPDNLGGISGCPIWQLYYEGLPSKLWTPNDAVVVGVQTGVYRNGTIIKGTRWWVVEAIIRHAYPELLGSLDLVTSTV